MNPEEYGLDVVGFPGYRVTENGEVWSFKYGTPRILRQSKAGRNYLKVGLTKSGKQFTRYVHQLVCIAFHGPRPNGMEVRHIDTDKSNNSASNLAWGTPRENIEDNHLHGKYLVGIKNPSSKLTDDNVREIRRLVDDGLSDAEIAKRYGVAQSQVWLIKTKRTWKHVA